MKIEVSKDVIWRELGGEIVMLDLANQRYFGLSGAGSEMWQLIVEHGSSDSVRTPPISRPISTSS